MSKSLSWNKRNRRLENRWKQIRLQLLSLASTDDKTDGLPLTVRNDLVWEQAPKFYLKKEHCKQTAQKEHVSHVQQTAKDCRPLIPRCTQLPNSHDIQPDRKNCLPLTCHMHLHFSGCWVCEQPVAWCSSFPKSLGTESLVRALLQGSELSCVQLLEAHLLTEFSRRLLTVIL